MAGIRTVNPSEAGRRGCPAMRATKRWRKELCEFAKHVGLYIYYFKLEYVLKRPKFLATCMYGIPFILLGNLAGNALALGRYIMLAAGHSDASGKPTASKGSINAIAIIALSVVILIHMSTRQGGILLNNIFATGKVFLLLAIILIGFIFRGDRLPQKNHLDGQNFSLSTSFADRTNSLSSYTQSLLVIMYSYSGFEQPFYVSTCCIVVRFPNVK
jgi:hypothetical protein